MQGHWENTPPPHSDERHDGIIGLIVGYAAGVLMSSFVTIGASCSGQKPPWVPAPFYTDGVLVWLLPLAVALPIFLWPASLVTWGIVAAYRKTSAAETFCGVSRWRVERRCRELCGRWRGDYRRVDVEQPHEDDGVSAELLAVASSSTDDEAGPESPLVGKPPLPAGDKDIHDGQASTSPTRGPDEKPVESRPPAYEP